MKRILTLFSLLSLWSAAGRAEAILFGTDDYVVRGCGRQGPFEKIPVLNCGGKFFCVNMKMKCNFVKKTALSQNIDWESPTLEPSLDWARFDTSIFCKPENGECKMKLDDCAGQSAKDAGCSLKQISNGIQTVPREREGVQ